MLGQIANVKSTFPGAFAALGVGAVAFFGQLPVMGLLFRHIPKPTVELTGLLGPTSAQALPFIIAFIAFFWNYASGFLLIAMGARWRGRTSADEALLISRVIALKDDTLTKYFFEQKALVDVYDGLGSSLIFFALGVGTLSFSFGLNLAPSIGLMVASATMLFAGPFTMWRESKKRITHLELIVQNVENANVKVK